eukprot:GHVT01074137.1.p1 GENE.GHVT01074137.1~~GHVT01074137.1.p1  ORF type:complete len:648 (-),score=147.98 GHVT01074137.1:1049-2992(-)
MEGLSASASLRASAISALSKGPPEDESDDLLLSRLRAEGVDSELLAKLERRLHQSVSNKATSSLSASSSSSASNWPRPPTPQLSTVSAWADEVHPPSDCFTARNFLGHASPEDLVVPSLSCFSSLFLRFYQWAAGCLDSSRDQLLDVAFVLLTHMFKALLIHSTLSQASAFLRRFSPPFRWRFASVLRQLAAVQTAEQLQCIPFFAATALPYCKYTIVLDQRALNCLRSYLSDTCLEVAGGCSTSSSCSPSSSSCSGLAPPPLVPDGLWVIENMLQSLVNFEPFLPTRNVRGLHVPSSGVAAAAGRPPSSREASEGATAALVTSLISEIGKQGGEAQAPLPQWGLPKQIYQEDVTKITLLGEKAKRSRFLGVEAVTASDLCDASLLPPLPERGTLSFLHHRKRIKTTAETTVPVSSDRLPSILCFTLLNSSDLSCAASSSQDGARQVAAAYGGRILLFDLLKAAADAAEEARPSHPTGNNAKLSATNVDEFGEVFPSGDSRGSLESQRTAAEAGGERGRGAPAVGADAPHSSLSSVCSAYPSARTSSWLYGHDGTVTSVCFGEGGRVLFSSSSDGSCRLWSTASGSAITSYWGGKTTMWSVDGAPFGWAQVTTPTADGQEERRSRRRRARPNEEVVAASQAGISDDY